MLFCNVLSVLLVDMMVVSCCRFCDFFRIVLFLLFFLKYYFVSLWMFWWLRFVGLMIGFVGKYWLVVVFYIVLLMKVVIFLFVSVVDKIENLIDFLLRFLILKKFLFLIILYIVSVFRLCFMWLWWLLIVLVIFVYWFFGILLEFVILNSCFR